MPTWAAEFSLWSASTIAVRAFASRIQLRRDGSAAKRTTLEYPLLLLVAVLRTALGCGSASASIQVNVSATHVLIRRRSQ